MSAGIATLAEHFASGHVIDAILVLVALEALLLTVLAMVGKGPSPRHWLASLAAGALLMLGLRAALTGAPWPWIALALTGALIAHLIDLSGRFFALPPVARSP